MLFNHWWRAAVHYDVRAGARGRGRHLPRAHQHVRQGAAVAAERGDHAVHHRGTRAQGARAQGRRPRRVPNAREAPRAAHAPAELAARARNRARSTARTARTQRPCGRHSAARSGV